VQPNSRVIVLLALALTAGCSRPVAPVAGNPHAAPASAASSLRGVGVGAASHLWRVQLHFVGPLVTLDHALQPIVDRSADFFVFAPQPEGSPPDTVPAYSTLTQVRWRRVLSQPTSGAGASASGTFDEAPVFVDAGRRDSTRTFAPGTHRIVLQVPQRAGGGSVTVDFFAGFVPGAWWAGPDPDLWPRSSDGDGRAVDVTDWSRFATVPAWPPDGRGYFGPDSFRFVPSQRHPVHDDFDRRTFYEISGNRIYARSEGDSVHANAWIVLCNGGYDKDSPYDPIVDPSDPALPPGFPGAPDFYPVLLPQGLLGSPTAFRSMIATRLSDGTIIRTSQSTPYPNYDPVSVFRAPHLAGYWPAIYPGKSYAWVNAVDSDGLSGPGGIDVVDVADRVDAGGGTPRERLLRRGILTFFVRPAPSEPADGARSIRGTATRR